MRGLKSRVTLVRKVPSFIVFYSITSCSSSALSAFFSAAMGLIADTESLLCPSLFHSPSLSPIRRHCWKA
ncbi:hypothetical protein Fmac_020288 [Flemingia macrophylla]|uniref:Secreted protein n=1 Tax=Flemingia macrophylla TaxID=520843 RepID=A0ABD1LTL0_9FABA